MKIQDIANALGVSKSTVSLAINNKPGISTETREKIMKMVKESGYITRPILKTDQIPNFIKTIKFIACIKPETNFSQYTSSSFFVDLIHGLEKECSMSGYSLTFSTVTGSSFKEQLEKIKEDRTSSGTVLLGTNLTSAEIQLAVKSISNLVVLDTLNEYMPANFVVMNNPMGGYNACSYLIQLGHRDIGYVQSRARISNFELRKRGFMEALSENGLDVCENNIFFVPPETKEAGNTFKALVANRNTPLPTALFCESDYIAIGVIKALQELGKRVPGDISVIGFDDVPEGTIISPQLTTINVRKSEMGALAAQRLFGITNFGSSDMFVNSVIETTLIKRESCRHI